MPPVRPPVQGQPGDSDDDDWDPGQHPHVYHHPGHAAPQVPPGELVDFPIAGQPGGPIQMQQILEMLQAAGAHVQAQQQQQGQAIAGQQPGVEQLPLAVGGPPPAAGQHPGHGAPPQPCHEDLPWDMFIPPEQEGEGEQMHDFPNLGHVPGPEEDWDEADLIPIAGAPQHHGPEEGEEWPEEGEQWPEEGEEWPEEGEQWPEEGEQWPEEGEQWPEEGEQWPEEGPQEEGPQEEGGEWPEAEGEGPQEEGCHPMHQFLGQQQEHMFNILEHAGGPPAPPAQPAPPQPGPAAGQGPAIGEYPGSVPIGLINPNRPPLFQYQPGRGPRQEQRSHPYDLPAKRRQ